MTLTLLFPQAPAALAPNPAMPLCTVAPVASGDANVGETLSCTDGTWSGAATIVFTYQWYRVGEPAGDFLTDEGGSALLDETGEELTI